MSTPARIAAQLNGLVQRGKRDAMQRAVLAVEAGVKRETPVKKGHLRRSITSRVESGGDRGIVGTNLGYARAVHEGTRPRVIVPRRAKALFWKGARHPVRSVRHPGSKGQPFLVRGLDRTRGAVERELAGWGNRVLGSVR
jgi:hypothetical protein